MTEELENVEEVSENPETETLDSESRDDEMQKPMYNKRQMSDVVEREKRKAHDRGYERAKKEFLMQMQQEQQPVAQQAPQQSPVPQQMPQGGMGGMSQMSQSDIEKLIAERAPQAFQQHLHQMHQEHTVNTFVGKMQQAESKHPGLEKRLNDLTYTPNMVKVIEMANGLDNTADVIKDLLDNPQKLSNVLTMVKEDQPAMARHMMMELGNSIKMNQDALAQEKQARDPLSQLKPSTSSGMDDNDMSVSDLRAMLKSKR